MWSCRKSGRAKTQPAIPLPTALQGNQNNIIMSINKLKCALKFVIEGQPIYVSFKVILPFEILDIADKVII